MIVKGKVPWSAFNELGYIILYSGVNLNIYVAFVKYSGGYYVRNARSVQCPNDETERPNCLTYGRTLIIEKLTKDI